MTEVMIKEDKVLSKYSHVTNVRLFDLDHTGLCSTCKRAVGRGAFLRIRNERIDEVTLCIKHALRVLSQNVIDLPSGAYFIFNRKYADLQRKLLKELSLMDDITIEDIHDKVKQGKIDYWHEDYIESKDISKVSSKFPLIRKVYTLELLCTAYAAIYQQSDQRFEVLYFHEQYIELGEYAWVRTELRRGTFARDIQSAIDIALFELYNRGALPFERTI